MLLISDLTLEAKVWTDEKVLMSRTMTLRIPEPAVLVRASMVALAASPFAVVRAVMVTEEAPRLMKWIWETTVSTRSLNEVARCCSP